MDTPLQMTVVGMESSNVSEQPQLAIIITTTTKEDHNVEVVPQTPDMLEMPEISEMRKNSTEREVATGVAITDVATPTMNMPISPLRIITPAPAPAMVTTTLNVNNDVMKKNNEQNQNNREKNEEKQSEQASLSLVDSKDELASKKVERIMDENERNSYYLHYLDKIKQRQVSRQSVIQEKVVVSKRQVKEYMEHHQTEQQRRRELWKRSRKNWEKNAENYWTEFLSKQSTRSRANTQQPLKSNEQAEKPRKSLTTQTSVKSIDVNAMAKNNNNEVTKNVGIEVKKRRIQNQSSPNGTPLQQSQPTMKKKSRWHHSTIITRITRKN